MHLKLMLPGTYRLEGIVFTRDPKQHYGVPSIMAIDKLDGLNIALSILINC